MKAERIYVFLHIILLISANANAFDAFTATVVGAFSFIYNNFQESCGPKSISFNATGLEVDLERRLFGQHIALRLILKAVNGFMNNDNPTKPLVLSLHGSPGTGKNHVSKMIVKNLYKKGMDSKFVHLFISEYHFPHASQIETYKSQLQQWIKGNVTDCAQSLFIFDEMDKMHPGLIDCIKPYLGYYDNLHGVSYRKAIFIFLSNAGGDIIVQTAFEFWKAGRDREEIKLSDLETALSTSVFNNKNSGLRDTSLIKSRVVDFFVPFLPLEYKHVVQCTLAAMEARDLTPLRSVADQVAHDMEYSPRTERVFSSKGCKSVEHRLPFHL